MSSFLFVWSVYTSILNNRSICQPHLDSGWGNRTLDPLAEEHEISDLSVVPHQRPHFETGLGFQDHRVALAHESESKLSDDMFKT